jgi:hypothetical protein
VRNDLQALKESSLPLDQSEEAALYIIRRPQFSILLQDLYHCLKHEFEQFTLT